MRFLRRGSRGQALVEFALVFPVMLLIMLIAVDFGRLFFSYIQVNNAAREAANYAAMHAADTPFDSAAYNAGATDAALAEANVQSQRGESTLAVADPKCFNPLGAAPQPAIDCGAASDFVSGIGNLVTVEVTEDFTFFTPLITQFFGGPVTLHAAATAPVLNPPVAPPTPTPTPSPGSLVITKALAGDLTGFTGGDFTFSVSCDGTSYGPITINLATGSKAANAITGIPAGAVCTVTETAKPPAGANASWDSPAAKQATISASTQASVTITNTRTYTVQCTNPTVTITPNNVDGAKNQSTLTQAFTGTISSGTAVSWLWDWDDGTQDTTATTGTHTFIYTKGNGKQTWVITLTVHVAGGCSGSRTASVSMNP